MNVPPAILSSSMPIPVDETLLQQQSGSDEVTAFCCQSAERAGQYEVPDLQYMGMEPVLVQQPIGIMLGVPIPFSILRRCERWERFTVGEVVGVQLAPPGSWVTTQIARILSGRVEYFDTSVWFLKQLPFSRFRKIITMPGLFNFQPAPTFPSFSPVAAPASVLPPPNSASVPLDSFSSLLQEFSRRPLCQVPMVYQGVMRSTKGYFASEMQKEMDQQRLVRILEAHNAQFCNRAMTSLNHKENSAGILEEKLSPSGTKIFARADFHSDLPSFIAQQNMLQGSGHLDASYRCLPNRLVYLLGDYIDRGINDIEMLSLLLTWRMENPNSVSLLRGNHEDVEISMGYSTDVRFLECNKKALSECFETFPLEVCIASQEAYIKDLGAPQHQYLHLSHALFSPAKIVSAFLRGVDGISCIEKTPVFSPAERVSLKARRIFDILVQKFQGIPEALHSAGCMWSDIGRETEPSSRGRGYVFSPDDIHQCFQSSSGGPFKIFACLRGHEHMYQEHEVERKAGSLKGSHKVIATTLPVSMATGVFDCEMPFQRIQGLMLTVHPKGSDWKKSAVLAEIDEETRLPKFHIQEESIGMYEKFRPELNEGDHGQADGETESFEPHMGESSTLTEQRPRLLTAEDLL